MIYFYEEHSMNFTAILRLPQAGLSSTYRFLSVAATSFSLPTSIMEWDNPALTLTTTLFRERKHWQKTNG